MSEQKRTPFDLERFKAGMKAKWGNQLIKYDYTATNGFICFEFEAGDPSYSALEDLVNAATMVSRHQHLIDSYDPEDTWQYQAGDNSKWWTITGQPEWGEDFNFRLHPHNDLIKAFKIGKEIVATNTDGNEVPLDCLEDLLDPHKDWDDLRIKPEPTIHCLVYDAKRFDHEQTTAVRARVVKKEVAQANGWKIIQEWEV